MSGQNNGINLPVDINSDGFAVAGGTTARKLTVSGGDINMVGGGGATVTFPTSTSTLATTSLVETLTNKTLTGALGTSPKLNEPGFMFSTDYPASSTTQANAGGKFVNTTTGTGSATYTAAGLTLSTGASSGGAQRNLWTFQNDDTGTLPIFTGQPKIGLSIYLNSAGTLTGSWYGGLGNITVAGTGHTFTGAHIGFKITTSGGVTSLFGTMANGTTESATTALTTLIQNDALLLRAIVNSGGDVDVYYNKNFSGWSGAMNIPNTNSPSAVTDSPYIQQSVSNNSTANTFSIITTQATISY